MVMKISQSLLGIALVLILAACVSSVPRTDAVAPPTRTATPPPAQPAPSNVFLQPSTLPYEMPPFDRITDESYRPGFDAGMAEQRAQIAAIANAAAAPSFENTIVLLERSGRILYRVSNVFFNLQSANGNPELDAIARDYAPKLSEHQDAIYLDSKLFARVKALYDGREALHLDPESAQLLSRTYLQFVRAGGQLLGRRQGPAPANQRTVVVADHAVPADVRKATQDGAVAVDNLAELDGFSAEQIGAAAAAAKARNLPGKWLITLQNTTIQPPLAQLKNRALRERIYRASDRALERRRVGQHRAHLANRTLARRGARQGTRLP